MEEEEASKNGSLYFLLPDYNITPGHKEEKAHKKNPPSFLSISKSAMTLFYSPDWYIAARRLGLSKMNKHP